MRVIGSSQIDKKEKMLFIMFTPLMVNGQNYEVKERIVTTPNRAL
jgi:hypothetical protein